MIQIDWINIKNFTTWTENSAERILILILALANTEDFTKGMRLQISPSLQSINLVFAFGENHTWENLFKSLN